MKITINGKVSLEALSLIINEQKEKTKVIDDYCKKEKLNSFYYKDAELEYEYKQEEKVIPSKTPQNKKEVETR